MKPKLSIIKGGINIPEKCGRYTFISGNATDTRLMGVTGLELIWDILRDTHIERLHQVFYLDSEEYGIESYTEGYGEAPAEVLEESARICKALGGNNVPVSEKEARFIVQSHVQINKRYNQALPENHSAFEFLLNPVQTLTGAEYRELFKKLCGRVYRTNYVINYFLMRCVSGDARGAAWLLGLPGTGDNDMITPEYLPDIGSCSIFSGVPETLCRNSIAPAKEQGENTFFCESLIEYGNRYSVLTSLVTLNSDHTRVVSAEKQSEFKVTGAEAAMLSSRSEFITIYEVLDLSPDFMSAFERFTAVYTETVYNNGKLYLDFKESNYHVGEPVYIINNDIHALYYLSDSGQLIIMGYTFQDVQDAEFRMYMSLLSFPLALVRKYEFKEPIFYEFLKSDFTDFDDFLDFLGDEIDMEAPPGGGADGTPAAVIKLPPGCGAPAVQVQEDDGGAPQCQSPPSCRDKPDGGD